MHPELNHDKLNKLESKECSQQPKKGSNQLWWKIINNRTGAIANWINNRIISSGGSEMRSFPIVKTYLAPYCKFITGEISLKLNLLEATDKIVYIIESLIKSYFHAESSECCLLASDVKKVQRKSESISYMVYISCISVSTY